MGGIEVFEALKRGNRKIQALFLNSAVPGSALQEFESVERTPQSIWLWGKIIVL